MALAGKTKGAPLAQKASGGVPRSKASWQGVATLSPPLMVVNLWAGISLLSIRQIFWLGAVWLNPTTYIWYYRLCPVSLLRPRIHCDAALYGGTWPGKAQGLAVDAYMDWYHGSLLMAFLHGDLCAPFFHDYCTDLSCCITQAEGGHKCPFLPLWFLGSSGLGWPFSRSNTDTPHRRKRQNTQRSGICKACRRTLV